MVVRISNSYNMDARALAHLLHEGYCTNYILVNLQYIDCFTPLMYGFIMQQYYIIYNSFQYNYKQYTTFMIPGLHPCH